MHVALLARLCTGGRPLNVAMADLRATQARLSSLKPTASSYKQNISMTSTEATYSAKHCQSTPENAMHSDGRLLGISHHRNHMVYK